ncbi:unnamed protein product [Caenorhabditis auriculariae]|uniref:Protein kinase domain-containing protein n=1 Tax=Caenorhabditis auriculariae TaxID=2777116 RepID=A0A8S1HTG5_9PELO|nr:unnamed protein product [Caenorhabditis auriculariae]
MGSLRPQIHTTTIINGKYMAVRKLGEGGCGVIYEVALLTNPQQRFACKAEVASPDEDATLAMESNIMEMLTARKSLHAVNIIEKGKVSNYNFIVMTLLGPSLDVLRLKIPFNKFSLFTTIVVGIQGFDAIQELHELGYIHRDVKPANFAIGALGTPKQRLIHILDFGIARGFLVSSEDGEVRLRKPRKVVPFRGTMRYCSTGAQDRCEQGRHDDLWSLFYVMVEMLKGVLPWAGITENEGVRLKKLDLAELYDSIPDDIVCFGKHLERLSYGSTPDYPLLRGLLCNVFTREQMNEDMKLDWESGGKHGIHFEKSSSLLPLVVEKDISEFSLHDVLRIPFAVRNFSAEEMTAPIQSGHVDINTRSDDTLDEKERAQNLRKPAPQRKIVKKYCYQARKDCASTTQKKVAKAEVVEAKWREKRYHRKTKSNVKSINTDLVVTCSELQLTQDTEKKDTRTTNTTSRTPEKHPGKASAPVPNKAKFLPIFLQKNNVDAYKKFIK